MVQAFRRDKNGQPERSLILRGLDVNSDYQIADVDAKNLKVVSGKVLMETGMQVEIPEPRGAALLFYQKVK